MADDTMDTPSTAAASLTRWSVIVALVLTVVLSEGGLHGWGPTSAQARTVGIAGSAGLSTSAQALSPVTHGRLTSPVQTIADSDATSDALISMFLLAEDSPVDPVLDHAGAIRSISVPRVEGLHVLIDGAAASTVHAYLLDQPFRLVIGFPGLSPDWLLSHAATLPVASEYIDEAWVSSTAAGSARLELMLAPDYARNLPRGTVPFRDTRGADNALVLLPEAGRSRVVAVGSDPDASRHDRTPLQLNGVDMGLSADSDVLHERTMGSIRLQDFVNQVVVANSTLNIRRAETAITDQGIERARSRFQPVASLSARQSDLQQRNTVEEQISRGSEADYERMTRDGSVGVSILLGTGATLEASASLEQIDSSLQPDDQDEYRSFYGVSLTQPLARNAGPGVTRAPLRLAELEARAARDLDADTTSEVVSRAAAAYLDLRLAQERLAMWNDGLEMARQLLREARSLRDEGRLPETAVLDVESSLMRYEAGLSAASQTHREAMNAVRSLVMQSTYAGAGPLLASDPLPAVTFNGLAFDDGLERALANRPDYLALRQSLERQGIEVDFARNQALPQIDLVASYGIQGLEAGASEALWGSRYRDYPQWSVGLQMTVPVGRNRLGLADLESARLRQHQALIELHALQVTIANDLDSSLHALQSHYEQWHRFNRILAAEERLLEAEREMLRAGRTDLRNLLTRQEVVINARSAVLEQNVAFAKAELALDVALGRLLSRFDVTLQSGD